MSSIDKEIFPSILVACLGLELWSKRAKARGDSLRTMFATLDNRDRDAVVVRVGPRAAWLRSEPRLARDFLAVEDLQLVTIGKSIRSSTTLEAFGSYCRIKSGMTPAIERELMKMIGEEGTL